MINMFHRINADADLKNIYLDESFSEFLFPEFLFSLETSFEYLQGRLEKGKKIRQQFKD